MIQRLFNCKKGAALLEYSLLAAGVSLVAAAGVAVFGHKTSDMISAVASIMPGAHADDNGAIVSGKIIETAINADNEISGNTDATTGIPGNFNTPRLGNNLGVDLSNIVLEAE